MVYDNLKSQHSGQKAVKEYLCILNMAAKVNEAQVDDALECLFNLGGPIKVHEVQMLVDSWREFPRVRPELQISKVELREYDGLLAAQAALK